jgi:hypothetical protein
MSEQAMPFMKRIHSVFCAALLAQGLAFGQTNTADQAVEPPEPEAVTLVTLASLAERADVIAIAQVTETEYTKVRGFPNAGQAILTVLIPYKGTERGELLQITEEGLEETACYYPEVGPFQFEGDRFLVFLRKQPDKKPLRGRLPGCRIPVLVTQDSRYAVRFPVDGVTLPEDAVTDIEFSDPSAFIDAGDLSFAEADALEASGYARPVESDPFAPNEDQYIYTRGVKISELRRLMFPSSQNQ